MASHAANEYSLSISKQSAKGTPALANTGFKLGVISGDVDAAAVFQQLAETDASIQGGSSQRTGGTIGGTPGFYLRPRTFPLFAHGLLGANADSGAGPYLHTITPAAATPYYTVWVNRGSGTEISKYSDCRITAMSINLSSGGFLTFTVTISGLTALFGTTDNSATLESEAVFIYPELVVLSSPARTAGIVQNVTLDISRNGAVIPGDNTYTGYDIGLGKLDVSGSFSAEWETDADFRTWVTGSSSGTAFGSTIATESLTLTATKSSAAIFQAIMAGILITQVGRPVSPGGETVIAAFTFQSQRQTAIADYIKFLCTNSLATVPGA